MVSSVPSYPPSRDLLKDKSVVITAAAGTGIGFATAKRCLEEGARVMLSDWHDRRLNEAVNQLNSEGYNAASVVCDVTKEEDVQGLISSAEERFGLIDVMVNNAGLGGDDNLVEMEDEQWNRILDVTLNGTMRCTRAALRHIGGNEAGVIVNNASVLGWRAQAGHCLLYTSPSPRDRG